MKFFRKTDLLVILPVLLLAVITLFTYKYYASGKAARAEIYYYNELVETVELREGIERRITVPQAPGVFLKQQADGSICFESSDCPDKVCVHTGSLSLVGQSAACLPNGIIVKIVPVEKREVDAVDIIVR